MRWAGLPRVSDGGHEVSRSWLTRGKLGRPPRCFPAPHLLHFPRTAAETDPAMTDPLPPAAPPDTPDDRLRRIEEQLAALAAQAAAGPPPAGYAPRPNPLATVNAAVQVAQAAGYLPGGAQVRRGWRKWPVARETILLARLYLDRRYSPTRAAQLGVPALLVLLVLTALFFNLWFTLPVLSQVLEYLVVMAVAVLLYLILATELGRYEQVLDYLAKSGRA